MASLDQWPRRYLSDRARVRHLLEHAEGFRAVCGTSPRWSRHQWLGTGCQVEYETVDRLPDCRRCVALVSGEQARRFAAALGRTVGGS